MESSAVIHLFQGNICVNSEAIIKIVKLMGSHPKYHKYVVTESFSFGGKKLDKSTWNSDFFFQFSDSHLFCLS